VTRPAIVVRKSDETLDVRAWARAYVGAILAADAETAARQPSAAPALPPRSAEAT
jgi:hypothetical protein